MGLLRLKDYYIREVGFWVDFSEEKKRGEVGESVRRRCVYLWTLLTRDDCNDVPGKMWPSVIFRGYEE